MIDVYIIDLTNEVVYGSVNACRYLYIINKNKIVSICLTL